ncbi:hypothetical protein BWI97_15615 [Siphonobacter sp. BAB-5405]|uniref:phage integrase SAM-like domain-containing protein n=1 Tax=Siphonobacter sp. BAB-5405 TaxID=1864825 RepID=UPI000C80F82C|nr:phage integrase SAM-like domain-containing protein [Siphonobacter sp. BAB-5405]PMD94824.1 hypothetical protein BWI97_15615 [Siphonobacter sp. BAB-5405]
MSTSFNIELSPRPNREGLYTIYLRITVRRQHKRIKTSILIEKKFYNPEAEYGRWIRKTHARSRQINEALVGILDQARSEYEGLGSVASKEAIAKKILNPDKLTLADYMLQCIQEIFNTTTYDHATQCKCILNQFVAFLPKDILLTEVTTYHINQYKVHLLRKNHANTARHYLKKIGTQFRRAYDNDLITKNPYDKIEYPKSERCTRKKMSDAEIDTLNNVKAQNPRFMGKWDEIATELYYFSYLHGGIRLGDMVQLRVKDFQNGRLTYEMNKTGVVKSIKIRHEAQSIFDKYCNPDALPEHYFFPLLDNDAPYSRFITKAEKSKMPLPIKQHHYNDMSRVKRRINAWLKRKALLGELEGVTFHTARHSFADKARRMMKEKKNITIDGIRLMLGHSSLATTQRYLNSFDLEGQDDAHDAIFGD